MKMKRRGDLSFIKEKYGKENGIWELVKFDLEILLEENMRKWVFKDVRRGLVDLVWNKKVLYVDFFKLFVFYGCCLKKMF